MSVRTSRLSLRFGRSIAASDRATWVQNQSPQVRTWLELNHQDDWC